MMLDLRRHHVSRAFFWEAAFYSFFIRWVGYNSIPGLVAWQVYWKTSAFAFFIEATYCLNTFSGRKQKFEHIM
jgi:hypothetical protein